LIRNALQVFRFHFELGDYESAVLIAFHKNTE